MAYYYSHERKIVGPIKAEVTSAWYLESLSERLPDFYACGLQ